MIKAVLFDLDGTLYDRDRLASDLFPEQYSAFAHELTGISQERFLREVAEMDDHGYGPKDVGYRSLVQSWGLEHALAERLLAHFRESYERHCHLRDDVRYTLDELRRRHLKLAVVTNGPSVLQRRKLAVLGIAQMFDAILVSEEEGVCKPDAEIFRRALERCGIASHEALFVGDHPVADIEGAHNTGLRVAWKFVPYWAPVITHAPVIRSLPEVLELLH